jgi:hypothetical protein
VTSHTEPLHPRRGGAEFVAALKQGALLGLGVAALSIPLWATLGPSTQAPWTERALTSTATNTPRISVDFGSEKASADVQHMANWAINSRDNQALSFVILDKLNAKVFVFDAAGALLGASPVLIGAAKGDDSVPDIGGRPMDSVQPHERTTPAGRFVGEPGRNANGEDIVWIDYQAAVSMHRVRANEKSERRLQRLATQGIDDNRISYGCVNLPVAFFEAVLQPAFDQRHGVIYVLPEVKPAHEVFKAAYAT